ncbi:flagellin N-terminal helical domain-containing protein [Alkalibacillus haloalkaliphilus]|uniref:flagellin N-terminal helical domain-containing protein n=1 Tax=Alkalibacillus haloalkaliphilus TaxID=94136 RepID=UPI0029368A8C|nr:flagellin [Alkalibacillus haloalkaliphilus]MDV2582849.1 flagellin [Alkalibacillus haloalkaliphilus]
MIINNNIAAMNTHRQMGINQSEQQSAMEKLSSGMRINKAGDDAAGLSISEKMRGQINGLEQASRNAQDSISLIQTAEGALDESHSILQRMREIGVQAANDTNDEVDRDALKDEIDQLSEELDRIAGSTEFNEKSLLDGDLDGDGALSFQIGANTGDEQSISLEISDMSASELGDGVDGLDISDHDNAQDAIENIDTAIQAVSDQRSELGAVQNRLEHTISNLDNATENLSAAESRIRDTDMASEMMEMTRSNILSQASQSMLAQANQQPQSVLQLLG